MSVIPTPARGQRPRRILIVEDDWLIGRFLADVIVEAGHRVIGPAATVDEALRLGHKVPIDAALMDLRLSGRFAYKVADMLLDKRIPFCLVTGYSQIPQAYAEVARIQKPFSARDIRMALDQMLLRLTTQDLRLAARSEPPSIRVAESNGCNIAKRLRRPALI